jgi:outer membrane protein
MKQSTKHPGRTSARHTDSKRDQQGSARRAGGPVHWAAVTACALALVLGLTAQPSFAQDGGKYGFVNIGEVITQSDEGQAQAAELESIGAGMEQELAARRQELEELAAEYQESVDSGNPDTSLRDRIERLQRELERDVRQAQSDVDASRQDRIQAIGNKVVNLVRQYGQENGYTAIFRSDGGQVLYADPAADITDEILNAYNQAHPVQ